MTFHMQYQLNPSSGVIDVDITDSGVVDMRLAVRKSAPAMLSWVMKAPQQQEPIPSGSYVRIWDDTKDWESIGFSATHPIFEGFCRCTPGRDTNDVSYVAFDPTSKAASDIDIMSLAWTTSSGNIITDSRAIPRLVFNTMNDNDDDWESERGHNGTLGQILAAILDDALLPLRYYYAAPPAAVAYESSDLSGLTYVPQKKIAFQSESVRAGVLRLLADHEPAMAMQFHPGSDYRKWRFYNMTAGAERTYTLNSPGADDTVLECYPIKSVDGCYTAVELYGPQTSTLTYFSTADGALTDISGTDPSNILETYTDANGLHTVYGAYKWQITDANYRVGARLLPEYIFTPVGVFFTDHSTLTNRFTFGEQFVQIKVPVVQASYDGGSTWTTLANPRWNFHDGTVTIGSTHPAYIYSDHPPNGTTQKYYSPNVVRIAYAPLSERLFVRYPSSGFSGSAYDDENVVATFRQYHEMLAVGYERGQPVTTAARLAQYSTLAQALHSQRSKTIWTGGMVLDGLKWDLVRLNRCVNIAGKDEDGNTVTTGMESMKAILTDVEYDFDKQLTTLTFSSNSLEVMGYNTQLLMDKLRIKALARRQLFFTTYKWDFMPLKYSWRGAGVKVLTGVDTQMRYQYYDPMYNPTQITTPVQYGLNSGDSGVSK